MREKREIDLFMFDLDGTLADTGKDLVTAVNHVRTRFRLGPLEARSVYDHVGRGAEHLIRSSLPEELQGRFQEAREIFLGYYERHLLDATVLYPRVRETLDYFKNKKRAVVSNKLHGLTVAILKGLGVEGCFDAVLGGDSLPRKKPDPEPLNLALRTFGVEPGRAVMVGDGSTDIEAGKRAGVWTCGVTYGLGRKEEIVAAGPDLLIDDIGRLMEHFC